MDSIGQRNESVIRIERENVYPRLEFALLYIISGYVANASGVANSIPEGSDHVFENSFQQSKYRTGEWVVETLSNFCKFKMNPSPSLNFPINLDDGTPPSLSDLTHEQHV